ncbi:helix-turn-helix domain-containing protein [Streptomyces sp. enrichment culture]|uniref:helix-turn-helix domain-containing protein n=1 Tax=Streptomyces sp. enrichment culture TaxID=1795815 RepID=UPI003F55BAEB
MADGERAPGPRDVHDPAGFIARLQELKDWSGLTYRELSARAEAVGESLPRSTVASMLSRTTLPREELLAAFVRACGAGPDEAERWLAARKRVAARRGADDGAPDDGAPAEPHAGAEPDAHPGPDTHPGPDAHPGPGGRAAPPPAPAPDGPVRDGRAEDEGDDQRADPRREDPRPVGATATATGSAPGPADRPPGEARKRREPRGRRVRDVRGWAGRALVPVVGGVALVVAVTTVASYLGDDEDGYGPAAAPPSAGSVDIRAVHSGLCLNERRGQQSGQVYQVDCAGAVVPRYSLARLDGGLWRIASDHPDYGPGCSGIPAETTDEDGAPLVDQECGKRGAREEFRIEPLNGDPARGHRIRDAATGLCLTVSGASRAQWTPVVQKPCAPDGTGQLFAFPHRPADR